MELIPGKPTPILVVDDDTGFLLTVKTLLAEAGMPEPALVSDSRRVIPLLEAHPFQFVLLDLVMPDVDGLELLRIIKERFFNVECVIITAMDDTRSAVQAIKLGAYDYLVKPVGFDKLIIVIKRALERYCLRYDLGLYEREPSFEDIKHPEAFQNMVAKDPAMARVFHKVEVVAPTDYSVVITGESGTGKEMIARTIHALSGRASQAFVPVNMGAVSGTLFRDDFFGHAKGAFTGAVGERKGFLEAAQGGTLFLDEIADLELPQQGGLLRVLQEREFHQLGSTLSRSVNLRVLAATNRHIDTEIEAGRFRADLFHRLNMFHIALPPLRERPKDILPLAQRFLEIFTRENGKTINSLAPDLVNRLMTYSFPGNVRELRNLIAGAILLEADDTLHLSSVRSHGGIQLENGQKKSSRFLTLAEMEQRHILEVLETVGGNRTHAAKILDVTRRTLQRKLKQMR
ncbi:MAG: sigma-54-dependent Fis family transcriptional regulator [Deltaproteobacteria bacterium]|nr:sigma-54-dependent Fis family transcriptional regulator [Deltaproteobacteria bacterium]